MGACGSSRQGPAQPQQAMCKKDLRQPGMPNDATLLSNRAPDCKKQLAEVLTEQLGEQSEGVQEELDSPLSVPDERPRRFGRPSEGTATANLDDLAALLAIGTTLDDRRKRSMADTQEESTLPPAPQARPDLSGEWKMVRYEGDFETWLKEAGVGWASRKAASAAGFGVNGTFASIQGTEEQLSIQSKSLKGTTLQELRLDGSEQDDKDLVHGTPIRVIPRWEEVDGKTVLTVEAPASKNKAGTVSTPLTRRYVDGGSMIVERTNASGTLIRLFFVKEG